MAERMHDQGVESLWLDATALASFDSRFPTISASLAAIGLDPSTDWLPIAPAAHYLSGGVLTDLWGATALPGLWAAGEVACTGVHGANRLASNSLLEGMVFGARLAETILAGGDGPTPTGVLAPLIEGHTEPVAPGSTHRTDAAAAPPDDGAVYWPDVAKTRDQLQRAMTDGAGVVRSADSLARAGRTVATISAVVGSSTPVDRAHGELANLVTAARSILESGTLREETRGAHARSDFPLTSDSWRCRIVHGAGPGTGAAGHTVLVRTTPESSASGDSGGGART
jgi:L-aspartate oxidase